MPVRRGQQREQNADKPGQGKPDTLSYDRLVPPESEGPATPAPQPSIRPTAVMPEGLIEGIAALGEQLERRTDPEAIAPAPQAPLALTPPAPVSEPVIDKAPGAFRAGDVVDHFEIVGLVGQGGMGCVYKAFDRELGRTVAIKTLHGIDQRTPQVLARFKREAQAASRVVHPNLVIIYSSGTHDNTPYIAMEYLSGRSLAAEIAEGPITVARTADILGAACAGVHAAHRAEVVHRDLKPANIFLARTPMGETPKILDFGISRIGDDNSSLTGTGDVVGTTYYLAPEQAAGRGIDVRVDQYALGVILYECLTGVRPFTGDAVYTIMRNIVEGVFEPPSHWRPEIPRELEAVILRAMSRAPQNRFPRVRDLGLALLPFMSAKGRQQWGSHFMAPEAEMPVVPSTAVPAPGAARPAAGAPALPQAPTKIILDPREVAPTRTSHPAEDGAPDAPQARPGHRPGVLVLAAAAVVSLALGLAWALKRPATREKASPSLSETPASPSMAQPVVPAPPPTPNPPTPWPPAEQTAEPSDLRKKSAAKIGKPREAAEPSEKAASESNRPEELAPKGQKNDMW
jgi:serine/threonine-protein kinase